MKKIGIALLLLAYAFTGSAQQTIDLNHWKFQTGDNLEWATPHFDDRNWKPINAGSTWEAQGYKGYNGYAWYRIKFRLPSALKKNAFFKDSVSILLGRIDDHEQTFLNGRLLGQNAGLVSTQPPMIPDLSKTPMAWDLTRNYTISVNDARLHWDQENVIAIRVFDEVYDGGLYSLPVNISMVDLDDFLTFDVDARPFETQAGGKLGKTILLQNHSGLSAIKGSLTMTVRNALTNKLITVQSAKVDLKKEMVYTRFSFPGNLVTSMKASYTFTEAKTGYQLKLNREADCGSGWVKYEHNPVLGGHLGTIFDPQSVVRTPEGGFRMYCSWRNKRAAAFSESEDGLRWSVPVVCLPFIDSSSWEKEINRPMVLIKDGIYHMWYTAEAWYTHVEGGAWIGYATSTDGKTWERRTAKPILSPELPWEGVAVRCQHVNWDAEEKIFKMWYSAGEAFEPDGVGYATSTDGIHWQKDPRNPVFTHNPKNEWEQSKVTACQVIKRKNDYLMFYIGFKNPNYAQIGMARSVDGITGWERYKGNPVIMHGTGWDSEAVYKPFAIADTTRNRWLLFFNARRQWHEQVGVAIHPGLDLGF